MTRSDRSLNRFDRQLWRRFITIAQPFWFPQERWGGWWLAGLLVVLLIFLFALLFVLVGSLSLISQWLFPEFTQQTAGGLVKSVQAIVQSPLLAIVGLALLIPAASFFYFRDQLRPRAAQWALLAGLLILALSVSGLNVVISFVGRFFQTALANKDAPTYWRFLFVYAGVFVVGTPIVVMYRYSRERLGLIWRDWLTRDFLARYFQNRAYYEVSYNSQIDNPDQRISEDIRSFTRISLQFLLLILTSLITLISFTGILWSISPFLSVVLVGYAVLGTGVTLLFGRRLIGLNFRQLSKEADFRYGLVHVRDNAESIAFYGGEEQEGLQVRQRLMEAIRNFNLLIGWQRNLGFFTQSYDYFVIILPSLVVAPKYFAGEIDFGAIAQASLAFNQVLNALSIIVEQIEQLSAFAAGVNRLSTFAEAISEPMAPPQAGATTIDLAEADQLALEHVTLLTPNYQQTLVRDLSLSLEPGQGLVIVGQSGAGKSSLLRAVAGLWNAGTGRIVRPPLGEMLFLPQRPYMILGTLREQLLYPHTSRSVSEVELRQVLEQVNLGNLPDRVGGFDAELDWADLLSLGEQQRLAFARLILTKPRYAILDEATSALDLQNEAMLYQQLRSVATVFISVGHRSSLLQYHQYVLELQGESRWRMVSTGDYTPNLGAFA